MKEVSEHGQKVAPSLEEELVCTVNQVSLAKLQRHFEEGVQGPEEATTYLVKAMSKRIDKVMPGFPAESASACRPLLQRRPRAALPRRRPGAADLCVGAYVPPAPCDLHTTWLVT